jgi:HD-GYP domain-containing protein (c-di-GMP phosphodiesterase class II)
VRLVPITRAAGYMLARDIPAADPKQMPLLRTGATVTDRYVDALREAGIMSVWVHDKLSEGVEPMDLVPPAVREEAARKVDAALAHARHDFARRQPLSPEIARQLAAVVEQIVASVAGNPGVALVLSDLASADAYTHQHSIDVCALGILLARDLFSREGWLDDRQRRRMDGVDRRLHQLGMGLLLHDVGKIAVPPEILNKPGSLTPEETEIVRTHPEVGAQLLAHETFSPVTRAIVREHHERWDGLGYPARLSGTRIHQLARIAAVADVYDAVTSERAYKPAQPPHVGVQVIVQQSGTAFDPEVVEAFRRVVHPYPVGTEVTVEGAGTGVVVGVDPRKPESPVVRFATGEVQVTMPDQSLAA